MAYRIIAKIFAAVLLLNLLSCSQNGTIENTPVISEQDVRVGRAAPPFTIERPGGGILDLSDYSGKVILIDFWASWCGPCVASLPELKALYNKFKGDSFVLISASSDYTRQAWKDFLDENDMPWEHGYDGLDEAVTIYGVRFIPQFFVIGKDGKILLGRTSSLRLAEEKIDEALSVE